MKNREDLDKDLFSKFDRIDKLDSSDDDDDDEKFIKTKTQTNPKILVKVFLAFFSVNLIFKFINEICNKEKSG